MGVFCSPFYKTNQVFILPLQIIVRGKIVFAKYWNHSIISFLKIFTQDILHNFFSVHMVGDIQSMKDKEIRGFAAESACVRNGGKVAATALIPRKARFGA